MDYSKLLSALKLPPYIFLGIALASGLVLFTPAQFTVRLGFESLLGVYRARIGVAFVLSSSIFVVAIAAKTVPFFGRVLRERWNARHNQKRLAALSPPEQRVLAEYLKNNTTTRAQHISDGVVGGLAAKRILYQASSAGHPGSLSFDYNLQPWAWEFLKQHPELVMKPPGSYDIEE
jgi:hypothetical protein